MHTCWDATNARARGRAVGSLMTHRSEHDADRRLARPRPRPRASRSILPGLTLHGVPSASRLPVTPRTPSTNRAGRPPPALRLAQPSMPPQPRSMPPRPTLELVGCTQAACRWQRPMMVPRRSSAGSTAEMETRPPPSFCESWRMHWRKFVASKRPAARGLPSPRRSWQRELEASGGGVRMCR